MNHSQKNSHESTAAAAVEAATVQGPEGQRVEKFSLSLTRGQLDLLCYAISRSLAREKDLGIGEADEKQIWTIYKLVNDRRCWAHKCEGRE